MNESQHEVVLSRLTEHIAARLGSGRSKLQIAKELSDNGVPAALATELVAAVNKAFRQARSHHRHQFRASCGEAIVQVGGRGLGLIALGGLLTLVTFALPLPIFVAFTGLAAAGLIDVFRAVGLCYRWLTVQ